MARLIPPPSESSDMFINYHQLARQMFGALIVALTTTFLGGEKVNL